MSVKTTLELNDRMTNGINRIVSSIERLTSKIDGIGTATERASVASGEMVQDLQKANSQASSFIEKLAKIATTIAGFSFATKFTLGEAMELDAYRREFEARFKSEEIGGAIYEKLQGQARQSAFSFKDLAQNTLSFMSATTDPKHLDGLNNLAEKLAIFDKTGQGLAGAGFSIKEAMSGDIVSLAERFNMSKADIRALGIDTAGKEGNIEKFIERFNLLLEKQNMGQQAYEKMLQSPKVQLSMFTSNIATAFAQASERAVATLTPLIMKLNDLFNQEPLQKFFAYFEWGLNLAVQGFLGVINTISWLGNVVSQNWAIIQPILIAISTVYIARMIAGLWAMIPPLIAQVVAWGIINAPILAIIAGVSAFLFLLSSLGVTAEDVAGTISGAFTAMWAIIKNIFTAIAKAIDSVTFGATNLSEGMQFESIGDAYTRGKANGVSLLDKASSFFTLPQKKNSDLSVLDGFKGLEIAKVGEVGEIGKVKEEIRLANEDLEVMRDVAEARYVQNFVKLTPQVSISGTTVNNNADFQAFANEIERKLEEEFASSASSFYR